VLTKRQTGEVDHPGSWLYKMQLGLETGTSPRSSYSRGYPLTFIALKVISGSSLLNVHSSLVSMRCLTAPFCCFANVVRISCAPPTPGLPTTISLQIDARGVQSTRDGPERLTPVPREDTPDRLEAGAERKVTKHFGVRDDKRQ
jgi:hypothetical protein